MDKKFYRIFDDLFCPACYSCSLRGAGKNRDGKQIIRCEDCGASFLEEEYYGLKREEGDKIMKNYMA